MRTRRFGLERLARPAAPIAGLLILLLLILPTAACYDVQHEVFGRKDGAVVPGLEGQYVRKRDTGVSHFTVSREQNSRDYRITKGTQFEVGSLRAIPLGNDLYIAQVHYAERRPYFAEHKAYFDLYALLLFRVTRSADGIVKFEEMLPDQNAASAVALRDGVEIWNQRSKQANGLSASRALLARFLRDLATTPLKPGETYLRVTEGGQ